MWHRATVLSLALSALTILPAGAQDLTGAWGLAIDLGPGGSGRATFVLRQQGTELSGTYSGSFGTDLPVEGTVDGARVSFRFVVGQIGVIAYEGTVDGEQMSGDVTYGVQASGTFEGSRAAGELLDEPIPPEQLAAVEGVYQLQPGFEINVFSREGQLFAQATNQNAFRLLFQGEGHYLASFDPGVWIEFAVEGGRAETLILFQGQRREAPRVR